MEFRDNIPYLLYSNFTMSSLLSQVTLITVIILFHAPRDDSVVTRDTSGSTYTGSHKEFSVFG